MGDRVLLHCQHSLGLGHLVRSFALAEGLAERFEVVVAVGGRLPAELSRPRGAHVLELPPLAMGSDGQLVSEDPRWCVAPALEARSALLRSALDRLRPTAIVVEMWPFGRKKLASEILDLLAAARAMPDPPIVLASVRDVLVRARRDQQAYDDRAARLANEHLDAVLVHGTPEWIHFEDSFRPATPLAVPVLYTGLVTRAAATAEKAAERDAHVLVSGGGGRYAGGLFRAAVDAFDRGAAPMRIVTGPFVEQGTWRALRRAKAGRPGLEVVREVPDLAPELAACAVSVSQCGYNTVVELLRARTAAVVVPFHVGREDEQMQRARRLDALGLATLVDPTRLDGSRLASAISKAREGRTPRARVRLDGAARSAQILADLLETRRRAGAHARRPECPA